MFLQPDFGALKTFHFIVTVKNEQCHGGVKLLPGSVQCRLIVDRSDRAWAAVRPTHTHRDAGSLDAPWCPLQTVFLPATKPSVQPTRSSYTAVDGEHLAFKLQIPQDVS